METFNFAVILLLAGSFVWLWQLYGPGSRVRRAFAKLPHVPGVFLLGNVKEMIGFFNYKHTFEALQKTGFVCGFRVATLRVRVWLNSFSGRIANLCHYLKRNLVQFAQVGDPVIAHELMQISETADKGWLYAVFEVGMAAHLLLLHGEACDIQSGHTMVSMCAETYHKEPAIHIHFTNQCVLEEHEERGSPSIQWWQSQVCSSRVDLKQQLKPSAFDCL